MNAIKLVPVLCAISLLAGLASAEIAEAKTRPYRPHVSHRYHRQTYQDGRQRASPRAGDFQRDRLNRSGSEWDTSCFSLPYLPAQYSCSAKGGDGL